MFNLIRIIKHQRILIITMYSTAHLQASFERHAQQTILSSRYFEAPLKISKTFRDPNHHALTLYMMDASPGLMEGDSYELDFSLKSESHAIISNQSFTKIHPSKKHGSKLLQRISLERGAVLEYMPEPTIPFKGSIYKALTTINMEQGATLFYSDILTAGRTHYEEQYAYESLSSQTEIYIDQKLVAYDHFLYMPNIHHKGHVGATEPFSHQAAFWIVSERVNELLLTSLRSIILEFNTERLLAGVSFLAEQGIIVRMLGYSVWELQQLSQTIWNIARSQLLSLGPCELRK